MTIGVLGAALIANIAAIALAIVTGHDMGPLDELALLLAGGVVGATKVKTP